MMIFQDPVSASYVVTDVEYCAMEGKDILHDEKKFQLSIFKSHDCPYISCFISF